MDIQPGDLWWDEQSKWSVDTIYLTLGTESDGPETWNVAEFMWNGQGYCGSPIRKMTNAEISVMTLVGNIRQIKSFDE